MSRLNRYTQSLISGYALLGINMLYTLGSVPLALHYLPNTEELGLWALTSKLGVFIAMVDFGLSASVARILIDHKDDRAGGGYGAMVKTGFLVGTVQGLLVLLVGTVLAFHAGPWLDIGPELHRTFTWLLLGQCCLLAVSFSTRTLGHILAAHQRFDIVNYNQAVAQMVTFGVTWFFFARGYGVMSILYGHVATVVQSVVFNWAGCARLHLLPRAGQWGRITAAQFKVVFHFGNDIFIMALGALLVSTSQTILVTRLLGLEAATIWNIFTRAYDVLQQVIFRLFDYSSSALAEMIVRGEKARLQARFRQIVVLSASLSVVAGVMFALCNTSFVTLWTSGRFASPRIIAKDIKSSRALAAKIINPASAPAEFLQRNFTNATLEQLRIAIADPAAAKGTAQESLAGELNRLVWSSSLGSLTNVRIIPPASAEPAPIAVAWANRHALEDAFPDEIFDSRKARWSVWNDLLLGLWLVICVSLHSHTGLVGQAKAIGFMRYLFFLEGLAFVGLTCLLHEHGGLTAMLTVSVVCSATFSFLYGLHRTRRFFGIRSGELVAWHRSAGRLALWLLPVATVIFWATHTLPALPRLALNLGLAGVWATFALFRFGLEPALREELLQRLPGWMRQRLRRLAPPAN